MARTKPSAKKDARKPKESYEDTLARNQGEKAYFDEKRKRGTYNRRNRDTLEKKVGRGSNQA